MAAKAGGPTLDEIIGELYMAWLKDTRDARNTDTLKQFKNLLESGYKEREFVMRSQRLGVNTALALSAVLGRAPLQKLDLYEN
eukprot:gene7536-2731_t